MVYSKTCTKCKKEKPLTEFGSREEGCGHRSHCKSCCSLKGRERRGAFRALNPLPPQKSEAQIKHKTRIRHLRKNYGISEEQVVELMNNQVGCCSICGEDFGVAGRQYCVDHDHATGEVRGLLCFDCNIKLGWYERVKGNIKLYERYLGGN